MAAPTDGEQRAQDADRVGLGVRGDGAHDLAQRAVVGRVVGRLGPVGGGLCRCRGGRGQERLLRLGLTEPWRRGRRDEPEGRLEVLPAPARAAVVEAVPERLAGLVLADPAVAAPVVVGMERAALEAVPGLLAPACRRGSGRQRRRAAPRPSPRASGRRRPGSVPRLRGGGASSASRSTGTGTRSAGTPEQRRAPVRPVGRRVALDLERPDQGHDARGVGHRSCRSTRASVSNRAARCASDAVDQALRLGDRWAGRPGTAASSRCRSSR